MTILHTPFISLFPVFIEKVLIKQWKRKHLGGDLTLYFSFFFSLSCRYFEWDRSQEYQSSRFFLMVIKVFGVLGFGAVQVGVCSLAVRDGT